MNFFMPEGQKQIQNTTMNRAPVLKCSPRDYVYIALSVFLLGLLVVPFAAAASEASVSATATVPPILLACAQATNPVAGFTCSFPKDPAAAIPDGPPYTIKCTDNSSAGTNQSIASWTWDFGDGGSSTDQNPQHTYAEASLYNIRLTVNTWCGSQYSNTTAISIFTYCTIPEPAFTINVSEGIAPLVVQVTDASKHTPEDITRWTYWFDDTSFSHSRNPVFTYTIPGIYTINQTVWKECVPISSTIHPPLSRRIIVHPPPAVSSDVNTTSTMPATVLTPAPGTPETSAVPGGTTPPEETHGVSDSAVPQYTGQNIPAITGPTGIAILPVIILLVIILGIIGMGIYLYITHKKNK